uniref:Uncharacterized protein n=1 Tax=Rhizophagus irregularis (strain DAOM 181602 / DAOM 197198 / MUCL 43194) TaxID=747089 RepID=U9UEQ7_RHIID
MSKPGRTTRSATRQDTVKEPGDGMEGIAKVIPPRNSFSFDSKKAKTTETPKNSTMGSTEETRKNQSTQPSMLNVNKDKVHVEINDDLPNKELSDKSPIDQDFQKKGPDGSADLMAKPLPEIVMDDPEITPITINKLVSLKAQCLLPEEEGSAAFCNFIIRTVKSKVDVTLVIQEKKTNKDGQKNHVISVKVGTNEDMKTLEDLNFNMPKEGEEAVNYRFTPIEDYYEKRKQIRQEHENRTIKVFNIPITMENATLRAVFN